MTTTRSLLTPGDRTDLIGLETAGIPAGDFIEGQSDRERVAVLLSGVVDVLVGGEPLGLAGGRRSVFEGPGHGVYVPPGATFTLTAVDGPAEVALASAPVEGGTPAAARLIRPEDQDIAERGAGNWARQVRTMLGPDAEAGRLLVGETVNPPGNWSSYPPHKHDEHRPPVEARLEEVYLFKVDPAGGFGIQLRYDQAGSECFPVRDGDVAAIRSGYHPVVAAPGYALYYLWIMAGEGRELMPFLDPAHEWVQRG
jgi:5-deoxy-glucuronate isomerase